MKLPRFTIANLMALVLLVALDVWAFKATSVGGGVFGTALRDLLVFGALPIANVLVIGLVLLGRARGEHESGRPALVGFELGGLAGLILFLACALTLTDSLHDGIGDLLRAIGLPPPDPALRPLGLVFLVCATALLLAPQVALALLGARLGRTYRLRVKITVERRAIPGPEPGTPPPGLPRLNSTPSTTEIKRSGRTTGSG